MKNNQGVLIIISGLVAFLAIATKFVVGFEVSDLDYTLIILSIFLILGGVFVLKKSKQNNK